MGNTFVLREYITFLLLVSGDFIKCEMSDQFRTASVPDISELSCAYDKCSSEPQQFCLNGGSCVFDQRTCESSCRCAEGYSGSICETTNLKVVPPNKDERPTDRSRSRMKMGNSDELKHLDDEMPSSLTTEMTTTDPKYNICKESAPERSESERACSRTFRCKYGVCEKSLEENDGWTGYKYDCRCDVGAVGLMCEHRCCLNCDHGTCVVHNGTEYCSCEQQYKGMRCEEYVPVPVKIKIHEVTWYLWVVGVCAAAFLIMITLSVVVPYYMWKHRVILIMKIVHYFQAYEDDGQFESHLIGNPEARFSRDEDQIIEMRMKAQEPRATIITVQWYQKKTDDKQWDAFISYKAHEIDEHFVVHSLYPKLEKELGFKLCLHFRDFIPGETIANNIINAVEASRRTIIIISPRYIQSEFTRFEYQKAQHEMLKRKHRIIPILLEDISSVKSSMDKNLKGIIDSVTYLEWPETSCEKKVEKFWKRLTLSLPKKKESSFESNIVSSNGFDSSKLSSSNFDSNKISSSTFSNIISSSNISSMNSESIFSPSNVKSDNNKVSEWLSTISDKIDQSEESENIYCEISQVDEKISKLNIATIPTLSEKEEEDMTENYRRSREGTLDSERKSDVYPHLSYNNEGRSAMQTQLSYNQSEVSSPTDSLAPLWVDKSEDEVEEKTNFRKFLNILESVTEV